MKANNWRDWEPVAVDPALATTEVLLRHRWKAHTVRTTRIDGVWTLDQVREAWEPTAEVARRTLDDGDPH